MRQGERKSKARECFYHFGKREGHARDEMLLACIVSVLEDIREFSKGALAGHFVPHRSVLSVVISFNVTHCVLCTAKYVIFRMRLGGMMGRHGCRVGGCCSHVMVERQAQGGNAGGAGG